MFIHWFTPPNSIKDCCWSRLNLGARTASWSPMSVTGAQVRVTSFTASPGILTGSWIVKHNSQNLNRCSNMRCANITSSGMTHCATTPAPFGWFLVDNKKLVFMHAFPPSVSVPLISFCLCYYIICWSIRVSFRKF